MLYYLAVAVYVLVCLVLMLVILLQQGKGGDIANAFGGGAQPGRVRRAHRRHRAVARDRPWAVMFMLGALAARHHGPARPRVSRRSVRSRPAGRPHGRDAAGTGHDADASSRNNPGPGGSGPGHAGDEVRFRSGGSLARHVLCSGRSSDRAFKSWSPGRRVQRSLVRPRGSGGIGRRTSLRGWRPQGREGSSPFFRTIHSAAWRPH